MAKEISRKFDAAAAAVIVTIEDELGARSVHTIHVLRPDGSEEDVAAVIAQTLADAAVRAAKIKAAFQKSGWRA
jgi:ribosomal protein L14